MREVHANNLKHHLNQLTRERDPFLGTEGYFYARQYISQELGRWGIVERQVFSVSGRPHCNLMLTLASAINQEQRPILIGAHYDTFVGSPGADDNASGVAVLLELARAFAAKPAPHPLRLVAFDLEEYGAPGSIFCAKILKQQRQPLRLMLCLEMLGYCDNTSGSQAYPAGLERLYPDRGNYIALFGNLSTIPDLVLMCRSMNRAGVACEWLPVPLRGTTLPDIRRSDHAAFWDAGYSAVMITDTASFRNPHYHKSSDTVETLDLEFLTRVANGLVASIRNLR
jgi:aminopeptidase YwaD